MHRSGPAVVAAAILAIEGVAMTAIALIELFALGSGDASSTASGVALIALTLIGAAALIAFAVGVLRGASWARSGGIVFQVLGIALALAALSIRPLPWTFVLVIGTAGIAGLISLIMTARQDGAVDPRLSRRAEEAGEEADDHAPDDET